MNKNKRKLTRLVEQEEADFLEAEILGHVVSYLLEKTSVAPLRANFTRQLESIDNTLFFFVNISLGPTLLNLHCQVLHNNAQHLLIVGLETQFFIRFLVHLRLELDDN